MTTIEYILYILFSFLKGFSADFNFLKEKNQVNHIIFSTFEEIILVTTKYYQKYFKKFYPKCFPQKMWITCEKSC